MKYSANTVAIAPRAEARIIVNSDQPNRNAGRRPHPSRRYTNTPPVCGSAPASSARVKAPQSVKKPPSAQSNRYKPSSGTLAAMPAGERKIPVPMVEPTSTAIALTNPRLLGSVRPRPVSAADASLFSVAVSTSSAEIIDQSSNRQGGHGFACVIDGHVAKVNRSQICADLTDNTDLIREDPSDPCHL